MKSIIIAFSIVTVLLGSAPSRRKQSMSDGINQRLKELQEPEVFEKPVISKPTRHETLGDIVRVPYMEHRVYTAQAHIGNPIMIELPEGEIADKVWLDEGYWRTHGNNKTNRVVVSPIAAENVIGKKTFVHIETAPLGLRISFKITAVDDGADIPGVYQVYSTPEQREIWAKRNYETKLAQAVADVRQEVEQTAQVKMEQWKTEAMAAVDEKYTLSGNIPIEKVVSDGTKTYIYTKISERGSILIKNKDGQEESVNFGHENGTYTVDRVLVDGEKMILAIGKSSTTIKKG